MMNSLEGVSAEFQTTDRTVLAQILMEETISLEIISRILRR